MPVNHGPGQQQPVFRNRANSLQCLPLLEWLAPVWLAANILRTRLGCIVSREKETHQIRLSSCSLIDEQALWNLNDCLPCFYVSACCKSLEAISENLWLSK